MVCPSDVSAVLSPTDHLDNSYHGDSMIYIEFYSKHLTEHQQDIYDSFVCVPRTNIMCCSDLLSIYSDHNLHDVGIM